MSIHQPASAQPPAGYSEADASHVRGLSSAAVGLMEGMPTHVALSALLTAYMHVAGRHGCAPQAAQQMVSMGHQVLAQIFADVGAHAAARPH